MLKFLNISNLALIDRLQIEFQLGLNVLSGETGSGKSIIIDSLGILLGNRISQDVIRTGENRAYVEGVFGCQGNIPLIQMLGESGIDVADEDIVIRREVLATGRGRIFVNDKLATIGLLKAIQPHILDIHGQGDQQSLLLSETHLNLLDAFVGALSTRQDVENSYNELLRLIKELESIHLLESDRLKSLDMVQFQISEIEQANLSHREDDELEVERTRLANAEKLTALCGEVHQSLYENEISALSLIASAQRKLGELESLDPQFSSYLDQITNAKYILDDLSFFIGNYIDDIQSSPTRLQEIEDRLIEIHRLKRKYGSSLTEIQATYDKLLEQKDSLLHSEERGKNIEQNLLQSLEDYRRNSQVINEMRHKGAPKLEKAIAKELADVALGSGRFSIRFSPQQTNQISEKLYSLIGKKVEFISRHGGESVEFYFSANTGEEVKPLKSVASGGEISRLMLVLKTITAPTIFPRTLIFDEIDSGIGGKVAEAVGYRLKRLAKTNQVLCITHQPQIARYADAHFLVSKEVQQNRTVTRINHLDKDGRVDELVRMIGGSTTTLVAKRHAKELLKID